MKNPKYFSVFALILLSAFFCAAQRPYFPSSGDWAKKKPTEIGFDGQKLQAAIDFAAASESKTPRNLELAHYQSFGREPFGEAVGPFKERGMMTGLIIRDGFLVASWGEPERVDMTFSVTKSVLSTVVGVAADRGLIRDLRDRAALSTAPTLLYVPGRRFDDASRFGQSAFLDLFATPHNQTITWDDFLRQTSDWEGTLWGKPDWADRPDRDSSKWLNRPRVASGTVHEYNDVRVNVLALAALNVWRRPLPEVLREHVMDPIGASTTWRWYGYEDAYVVIDGRIMQSVSGGGHWGGGMFINAYDMARFGLMTARGGRWNDRQILSSGFISAARTPTASEPTYGYMNWFLNTDRKLYPQAPATAFAHVGNGSNVIYVDPEKDLVVVLRWIQNDKIDPFLGKLYESLK